MITLSKKISICLLTFCVLLLSGCHHVTQPTTQKHNKSPMQQTFKHKADTDKAHSGSNISFVLKARSARIYQEPEGYQLSLYHVDPQLFFFTQKPRSLTGYAKLKKILETWNRHYRNNPPNAAFVAGMKESHPQAFELANPRWQEHALIFDIKLLHRKHIIEAGQFKEVSLFFERPK